MKRLLIVYGAFLLCVIAQETPQRKHLVSDLYVNPQPIKISGYSGSAMEPFISPDGRYLFFNNSNDPGVNTNLQFAERTGKLTFRYLGELPGVNSDVLDAVPSMDTAGHFYFTTVRDYGSTLNSLYTGEFDGKGVDQCSSRAWRHQPEHTGDHQHGCRYQPRRTDTSIYREP